MNTHQKGALGEDTAVEYLLNAGYSIETRNFRTKVGEIDIVARSPEGLLVFVEVKSATGYSCGNPLYWITSAKQKSLLRVASRYIYERKLGFPPCRMDVISVVKGKVDHIKNAFLANKSF